MIESSSIFVAIVLSLAVLSSMIFNPRRLEAIGYSLSVLFLQVLIAGHEDVFFICPQFPIYVSPQDTNLNPDNTMPDSRARGVYVDTALLLARCTRVRTNTACSIADAFRKAHQDRHFDLFSELDITSLEVPILEERKRGPTRHPKDLEEHFQSIVSELGKAQAQVLTQAEILLSSPRFLDQDSVILLATAGEYYRIAVLQRSHDALLEVPSSLDIDELIQGKDSDLGDDNEDFCGPLVQCSTLEKQRHQFVRRRREQEIGRQNKARDARAEARAARETSLPKLKARARQRSQFVLNAGPPPYPDGMIERYYELSDLFDREYRRYPAFFEPEPLPGESINSLAQLRDPKKNRHVVFTSVIRVGSSVSDKFVGIIRAYTTKMAHAERVRRD